MAFSAPRSKGAICNPELVQMDRFVEISAGKAE
jgi:hypothetical protein